jgi:hypothetical protein
MQDMPGWFLYAAGVRAMQGSTLMPPVLLAAILAAEGVSSVTVGSAALRLRGFDLPVGDLDIVPDLDGLASLCEAIGRNSPSLLSPSPAAIEAADVWSTMTRYERLDVLFERARQDGQALRQRATPIQVLDIEVLVASADDAWALRDRFKFDIPALRPGAR